MRKIYYLVLLLLMAGTLSAQVPTVSGTTKFKAINSNNSWYATVADIATAIGAAVPADEIAVGTGTGLTSYAGFTFDGASMHVEGDIDIVTNNAALVVNDNAASSSAQGGTIYATSTDGTALGDGHRLGGLVFLGSTGVGGTAQGGYLDAYADGVWSGTDSPTMLELATTPDASMVPVARLRVRETGNVDFLNAAEWRFYDSDNTNYTGFKAAGTISADRMLTLPTDTPSDGEQLTWHTGNTLSWDASGSGAGGGPDSTFAKTSGVYTGKRIGDNVYKQGTLALRSTDTTGILSIYNNSTTKPGLYLRYNDASSNGFNIWKIDPENQTNNSTVGSFNFYATNFDGVNVPYSTRANHVWRMGYNTTAGGGREVSTDADLHLAFESMFYNVYTTGRRKRSWEWHLQSQDTLGGVHRIISTIGAHDGRDGEFSIATNRFTLIPYTASSTWLDMDYINKNTYLDSMRVFFDEPQVGMPFLSFRNAANSAYLKILQSDASDRLVINADGNDIYTYSANLHFNTLATIATNDANPIQIGSSSKNSNLIVYGSNQTVFTLKNSLETTGWKMYVDGSELSFQTPAGAQAWYVHKSAPALSQYIEATTGDVGFGTASPTARLHAYSSSGATTGMLAVENGTGKNTLYRSNASPNSAITGSQGDLAITNISSTGNLWLKRTGTGNTGWIELGNATTHTGNRTLPTTVGNTVWLGVFTKLSNGGNNFNLSLQVQGGSVSIAKSYRVSAGYNSTASNWEILPAASSSGAFSGSDFEVEIKGTNGADSIRIRRTAGTASTTAYWQIDLAHGANTTFAEISSSDNPPTVTATFREGAIAVVDNKVGINNIAPARTLHVTGEMRVTDLTTDASTEIVGADADGDLAILNRSAELTIASGTLKLAQQGATSGQVLEWNGSAWAPAADDGGGGSSYYQTVRDDGTGMTQRAALNFVSSSTVAVAATDDSGNNETEISVSIPTGGVTATEIATDAVGSAEIATDAVGSAEIAASAVTYAKIQDVAANRLVGNPTGSAAAPSEISLGTGLGWTGTSIENTGDTNASDDAPADAAYVVTSLSAGLSAERAIAGGANITTTDGGANSNLTIAALGGSVTGTQITSDQDNYSNTAWNSSTSVLISGDANIRAITGFTALSAGTVRRLVNTGAYSIYVPSEHPDSDAANRVAGMCDYIIAANGGVMTIYYDGTSSRWRVENNTYNPVVNITQGVPGHFYQASVGATTGGDWGHIGFGLAGGANGTTAPTSDLPAGWSLGTSTSATGTTSLYFSKTIANPVELGSAHIITSFSVYFTTLSDGTNTYTFSGGLVPTPTSTTLNVNNSVTVQYTHGTNTGKFLLVSRDNAGTQSTADLGLTVAANTLYTITICYDKSRSEVRAYAMGKGSTTLYSARVTGNMPNAVDAGSRVIMVKSVGTTSREAVIPNFLMYTVY